MWRAAVPFLLLASVAAKPVAKAAKVAKVAKVKGPPPKLNPFFESLLKWWCEAMDNEADGRCNLLFTHRHLSQTSDGTQIRGLSAQMRRYLPTSGTAQRDQFAKLVAEYCQTSEAAKSFSCKRKDPWLLPVLQGTEPFPHPDGAAAAASTATPVRPATTTASHRAAQPSVLASVLGAPQRNLSLETAFPFRLRASAANASSLTRALADARYSATPRAAAIAAAAAAATATAHDHAPTGGAGRALRAAVRAASASRAVSAVRTPAGTHPLSSGSREAARAAPDRQAAADGQAAAGAEVEPREASRFSAEDVWEMGSSRGLRLNDAQVDAIHAVITGGGAPASFAVFQARHRPPSPGCNRVWCRLLFHAIQAITAWCPRL